MSTLYIPFNINTANSSTYDCSAIYPPSWYDDSSSNTSWTNNTTSTWWANDTTSSTWCSTSYNTPIPKTIQQRMREILATRHAPVIHNNRRRYIPPISITEIKARQTLRRIIGEKNYRRFVRDGFITVVAKSGLTYRIFSGHGITEVYDRGKMIDRPCVVLSGSFPPTDSLIMRYLLILNNEEEFSKHSIKHSVINRSRVLRVPSPMLSLPEQWSKLKEVA